MQPLPEHAYYQIIQMFCVNFLPRIVYPKNERKGYPQLNHSQHC